MDDEDEVLGALAESLSNFLEYIGGNQHAVILFASMEALCKCDESSVRDKVTWDRSPELSPKQIPCNISPSHQASSTLKKLIALIDVKKNEEMLMNLAKRLNESGYYLTKGPLSAIIPSFYDKIGTQFQQEMNR